MGSFQDNVTLRKDSRTVRGCKTTSLKVVGVLGFGGMANVCELLLNVVKTNKPKRLTGLNQKGSGMVWRYPVSSIVDRSATGEQVET